MKMKMLSLVKISESGILLLFFMIISVDGFSQTSFSLIISTPKDERIFSAAEDANGNYYIVGRTYNIQTDYLIAYLIGLSPEGELIFENEYFIEDTLSFWGVVYVINDSIVLIGAKGPKSTGKLENLWILTLDTEFNIIQNHLYCFPDYSISGISSIITDNGNFMVSGSLDTPSGDWDLFLFEVSATGDSIQQIVYNWEQGQLPYDIIQTSSGGYKIFAYGIFPTGPHTPGKIAEFDQNLNYMETDSVPYGLYFNHSARWLTDTSYIVTGNKHIYNPINTNIGIAILNESNEFILGNHFGKMPDTISYVGAMSNLDLSPQGDIFFGGTSNIFPGNLLYQQEDSWLMLINIDSDLGLNWKRFYGGNAYYYLWSLLATQDSGCLMLATRYDDNVQDQELDAYILKVDANGLFTSVYDIPSLASNEILFFPNPAGDHVTAQFPGAVHQKEKTLEIYNNMGILVKRCEVPENLDRLQIDVSFLPNGLYYGVMCAKGRRVAAGKMIIAR
jgi:hypothetical protein